MAWGGREWTYRVAGWGNHTTSTLAHAGLMGQVHVWGPSVWLVSDSAGDLPEKTLQTWSAASWHARFRQGGLTHLLNHYSLNPVLRARDMAGKEIQFLPFVAHSGIRSPMLASGVKAWAVWKYRVWEVAFQVTDDLKPAWRR